jgi:hypothetical protein
MEGGRLKNKPTCGHAALAIPWCSIDCELGTLPSGQVKKRKISPGEEGISYWRVGLAVIFRALMRGGVGGQSKGESG